MNNTLISENKSLKAVLTHKAKAKEKALQDCIELLSPFVKVETAKQRAEVIKDCRGYILKELRKKTSDFQSLLDDHQILEFFNVPDHALATIHGKLNADKQLQWNEECLSVIIPDVEEYATTPDQIERLEASQALIDAVKRIRSMGYTVHATQLALAVSNAVTSNGVELRHNPQFIKRKR